MSTFLVHKWTAVTFGVVLMEFLVNKLPELGGQLTPILINRLVDNMFSVCNDASALYMKLFKLIFQLFSANQLSIELGAHLEVSFQSISKASCG